MLLPPFLPPSIPPSLPPSLGPGVAEADENCKKFLNKTMPESFNRLLTHEAVFRWDTSIMEGILDMCRIVLELIAVRLKQVTQPIPLYLLDLLSVVRRGGSMFMIRRWVGVAFRESSVGRSCRTLGYTTCVFLPIPLPPPHPHPPPGVQC